MIKTKKTLLLLIIALFTFTFIGCSNSNFDYNNDEVAPFNSYDQIKDYMKDSLDSNNYSNFFRSGALESTDALTADEAPTSQSPTNGSNEKDYSKTNNQVEGVDESDKILTDGYFIYVLSGDKFFIVDADTLEIEYTKTLEDGYFSGMYLYNGKITLIYSYTERIPAICSYYGYEEPATVDKETTSSDESDVFTSTYECYTYNYGTMVEVLDVSDLTDVETTRTLKLPSSYLIESRMIEGQLYAVLNNYFYWGSESTDDFVPRFKDTTVSNELQLIPANKIYIMPNQGESYSFMLLVSMDVTSNEKVNIKAYLGSSWQLYMSLNNLYTIINTWEYDEATNYYDYKTFVVRFEIINNELVYKAIGEITGYPLNQFSMDEHDGVFRIATTGYTYDVTDEVWNVTIDNFLFLLDATSEDEMTLISKMSGLGKPGERIYSARFVEDIAYLVTFEQVDPLYKIDLSDPENPFVVGELEEEGVSDYLHVITDDLMIGVGRAVDNSSGWTNFTGVKIALYDTSGENPVNLETYLVEGEYSYTNVMWDHKAFLSFTPQDADFTYLAVPVFEYVDSKYSQSMYVFKVHHTGDLEYLTKLSHLEVDEENNYSYFDSIERAVIIDNYVYTVSYASISKFDINQDFTLINQTTLNENYYRYYYYGFGELMID